MIQLRVQTRLALMNVEMVTYLINLLHCILAKLLNVYLATKDCQFEISGKLIASYGGKQFLLYVCFQLSRKCC